MKSRCLEALYVTTRHAGVLGAREWGMISALRTLYRHGVGSEDWAQGETLDN